MKTDLVKNKECQISNWINTKIGNLVSFEYGKSLIKTNRDLSGKIPVYGSNGIVGYHSTPLVYVPCLIIGRKGAAGSVHISQKPCWPIDTTYYVTPVKGIHLSYFYYLFSSLKLNQLDKSTAIPGLNRNDVYDLTVSIPPLAEQKRIVSKIEELFTQLDKGVEDLQKVKAQLKQYRQSVLKYAFEGKLTEEWRKANKDTIEPADKLLERIQAERKRLYKQAFEKAKKEGTKKPQKPKDLPPVDVSGLPELPDGWKWCKLGELTILITKGASPKWQGFNYVNDNSQVLFVTSENVRTNILELENPKYLENTFNDKQKNSILKKGDVLLNIVGASIGRGCIFNEDCKANINQAVSLIRLVDKNMNKYLSIYLNSSSAQKYYNTKKVDVARANLSLQDVANIPLPFQSFDELQQIVSEIERCFSIADEVEKTVEYSLKQSERLRQSILKKAFSGKLVPQDENDEPASVLLERIKAEKG